MHVTNRKTQSLLKTRKSSTGQLVDAPPYPPAERLLTVDKHGGKSHLGSRQIAFIPPSPSSWIVELGMNTLHQVFVSNKLISFI